MTGTVCCIGSRVRDRRMKSEEAKVNYWSPIVVPHLIEHFIELEHKKSGVHVTC